MNAFDAETHTYTINDRTVPSVTQVLKGVFGDEIWYKDWYAERGRAIHQAIHYLVQNRLNYDSLDERIVGQIQAFTKFLTETGFTVLNSEIQMYSNTYQFAGTADLILSDKANNLILADIKSSIESKVDLQLAGYSILYGQKSLKKYCAVGLKEDGNYKMRWVNDIKISERVFMSCLTVYNWKKQNNMEVYDE